MFKAKINLKTFKHIINKKVISKFNNRIKTKYEILKMKKINLFVNNFCNLKCYSCTSLCDKPIGTNTFRDKKRIIDPEIVDIALSKLKLYKNYDAVTLYGGEPTTIPIDQLNNISGIVRKHGLKSILLTNAFNVLLLNPFDYDYIILDDHGINIKDVENGVKHFKLMGYEKYYINKARIHKNISKARKEIIFTKGFKCESWMKPSIWLDVVYPCCAMPQIEGFDNDNIITKSLRKNGWSINDPMLIDNIRNWKNTIPNEVIRKCLFSCWKFRKKYEEKNIVSEYLKNLK